MLEGQAVALVKLSAWHQQLANQSGLLGLTGALHAPQAYKPTEYARVADRPYALQPRKVPHARMRASMKMDS